ncbi:Uncharacterised protein [Candidatus Burarchaeum australiense]|nr:Uncharacterised protein [Candidatus Burarchaeum australiense]
MFFLKLSENDRKACFALLVVLALGASAYALLISGPSDSPSDGQSFYYLLKGAAQVGILYDVRGAGSSQVTAAYQCGVDMISRGRFAGKALENIACDESGCLSASTGTNGTNRMTYEQAIRKFASEPYILIKTGEAPSYQFFQRHMEITIGKGAGNGTQCDIAATES